MKIGFIAPALDLDRERQGERIFLLPPLTFPVLAAVTPPEYEIEVVEERVRPVDFNTHYDIVGLTYVTAFAPRAYEIADRFRQKGTVVVMGGPHATVCPDEALQHADMVVAGEAEELWPKLLNDFKNGQHQKIYRSSELFNLAKFPRPRLEVIPREFTFRSSTLASRGCPHHCNFCFTNWVNRYQQRFRPIPEVIRDIEAMEKKGLLGKYFVFWDDNLVGNKSYAKALFQAITPFRKKWAAAVSVNIASDPELLRLAARSGCRALFIGMESINSASLQAANKTQNHTGKYREMLKKLHDHDIGVTGAFVFGFDQDDESVFERTLEFCQKIELDCMTPAILTPLPGTPLYLEMQQDGRIIDHDWSHYDYFHVVYQPGKMSSEKLYQGFLEFNQDFFSFSGIFNRLRHSRTQLLLAIAANLGYQRFYQRMMSEYQTGLRSASGYNNDIDTSLSQNQQNAHSTTVESSSVPIFLSDPSSHQFTDLRVLIDAGEIFPYIHDLISRARKSVHLEMYLLEGKIGKDLLELLEYKAQEGVEVKIIYQPPSSFRFYQKIMKLLHLAGLKNRIQHYEIHHSVPGGNGQINLAAYPLHLFPGKFALKMAHQKMLIVDGVEAMIGGMNFASITEQNHDVMVAVRGPIVVEMEKHFELDWRLAIEKKDLKYPLRNQIADNASLSEGIQFLVTAPYLRNTRTFLLDQIRTVRRRILLEMYLLSDNEILNALIVAKRRGIEIKVILDANRLPLELDLHGFPNKQAVEVLMKNGIPVKIFRSSRGSEMHLKMALFDDQKIFIGSCNWTYGSFTFNSEGSFFINSWIVFPEFLRIFEEDWSEKSDYPQELTPTERMLCRVARLLQHYY